MLCSKCKIFSIHLSNYDSFICECGHVICRSCSEQNLDPAKCSLCGGKIVRLTEFHLEGHPKTVFRLPGENGPVNRDVMFTTKPRRDSNDIVNLYGTDDVRHDMTEVKMDNSVSFQDGKENFSFISYRPNTPTEPVIFGDPKIGFSKKSFQNNMTPNASVDEKYYFHTATNVDTDEDLSDSSTVIQHLSEFRRATNYTPPSNLSVYKVEDIDPNRKIAIITTSKTCLSCNMTSSLSSRKFRRSISAQTKKHMKKDASTAMEIDFSIEYKPSVRCHIRLSKENLSIEQVPPVKFQSEFSASLREKLKSEIYAPFSEGKRSTKNCFMVKGELGDVSPKIIIFDATATGKENYLTETIAAEIDKALKNLTVRPNVLLNGRVRREEILRHSKSFLRQKMYEEIYSPFFKCPKSILKASDTSMNQPCDPVTEQSESEPDQEIDLVIGPERTVAISTESYPKLGTTLSFVSAGNDIASHSFAEDAYIQETSVFDPSDSHLDVFETCKPSNENAKYFSAASTHQNCVPISNGKCLERQPLIKPIPVLPNSDNILPPRKKAEASILTSNEPLFDIPELNSECELANETLRPGGNTIYYCQNFTKPKLNDNINPIKSTQLANQVGDCLQQPENQGNNRKETDLLRFIQKHFPDLRLKDLKNIIMGIPMNEYDYEKSFDLEKTLPETNIKKQNALSTQSSTIETEVSSNPPTGAHTCQEILRQFNIIASRAYFPQICTAFVATPQYEVLPPVDDHVLSEKIPKNVPRACDLKVPRSPIVCPITACSKLVFVTEFGKHMKVDHSRIPVECISPGEHKNVFLESRLGTHGSSKCHVLFMVTNIIKDLGHNEFKNYLPVVLMSRRVRLAELLQIDTKLGKKPSTNDNCLMIWLAGVTFPTLPIYYTIVAWSRKSNIPRCHIAHSGEIYSMRNGQDIRSLFQSGQCLLLKYDHWMLLSDDGKDMLELQVVIH